MKKRKFIILLCISVLMLAYFCGCNPTNQETPNDEPTTLNTPTNIELDGYLLSWKGDDCAEKYEISIVGEIFNPNTGDYDFSAELSATETRCDLSMVLSPEKSYDITIRAIGNNEKHFDSEWAENVYFDTEEVTKGLKYTLNDDESYTVDRGTAKKEGRIVFPDTYNGKPVTVIEGWSFGYESGVTPIPAPIIPVTSVRLPLGCITIKGAAFKCTAITEVTLPKTLKTIGVGAFHYCQSLKTLTMNDGLEIIDSNAFGNSALTSPLRLPDSIKEIGQYAFIDTKVTEVVLNNIEKLGKQAFHNTPWFEKQPDGPVYLGDESILYSFKTDNTTFDEIQLSSKTKLIVPYAFEKVNATKITIPEGVESIPVYAFQESAVKEIVLPSTLTRIDNQAFLRCALLENITIPNSVTEIRGGCFAYCSSLKEITIPNGITEIEDNSFQYCSSLEKITIPNSVTKIGSYVFEGCENLENVSLPNGLNDLGAFVFKDCKALTEMTLPGVEVIRVSLFEGCENLTKVTLNEGSARILNYAFANCKSLQELILPNSITKISANAFDGSGLKEIVIPSNVTVIYKSAFANCENLTKVVFSPSVDTELEIADSAFENCINLTTVDFSNVAIKELGEYAFAGCKSLKEIVLPKTITKISRYTFANCSSLEKVTLFDGLTIIKDYAFYNCTALKTITIPETVNILNTYVFANCSSLENITLPSSATSYGKNIFENCTSLKSVRMNLKGSLYTETFTNCVNLESITLILDSNATIHTDAFEQCSQNLKIYFYGTKAEFEALRFRKLNEQKYINSTPAEITAPIYYYSETEPTQDGNYWHYVDNKPTIWTKQN